MRMKWNKRKKYQEKRVLPPNAQIKVKCEKSLRQKITAATEEKMKWKKQNNKYFCIINRKAKWEEIDAGRDRERVMYLKDG